MKSDVLKCYERILHASLTTEKEKPRTYEVLVGTYIHRIPVKGVLGGIHGKPFMVFGTQYDIPLRKRKITTLNLI